MKNILLPVFACSALALLAGCARPIAVPAPDQYGSAASLQNTPLHDQVPLVGYDGELVVGDAVDVGAVPVFTPVTQLDRATTFVTAELTPLKISSDGRNYTAETAQRTEMTVAYGRLGEAGTTATLGGYQFGFTSSPGSTDVEANNLVTPDRLVNYKLYRVGGQPPAASEIRGTITLPGTMSSAKASTTSLIRIDQDYYELKINVTALRVRGFINSTPAGSMPEFPDEGSGPAAMATPSAN
jgi:hypothetical protein